MQSQFTSSSPGLRIGDELYVMDRKTKGPAFIPLDALRRHVCILGTTGSGKTTSAAIICRALAEQGVSVAIIDRTGEYVELLQDLPDRSVLRPGENLTIALFRLTDAKHLSSQLEDWISILDHFFHVSYYCGLSPLQTRVLREVLAEYYHGTKDTLTISALISKLDHYKRRVKDLNGWLESIEAVISRLYPLTVDLVGSTLDRPYDTFQVGQLFGSGLTIADLSSLPDDRAKNLISQVILKQLYDAIKRSGRSSDLRLVAVVDEAQHLAPHEESYISIPERCAIELRKYGLSLIVCATRPSLISSNIIANSNTLITHMLNNGNDIERVAGFLVGNLASLKNLLRLQPVGHALVQVNHPTPLPAAFCRMEVKPSVVSPISAR